MLILSRKNGQKLIINDDIEITIVESKFDYCKIAIQAPKNVKIYREEVYKQIQVANKMSNKTSIDSIDSLTSMVNPNQSDVKDKLSKITTKKHD